MVSTFHAARWPIEFAAAGHSVNGETVSGDLHFVYPSAHGVLVAVVDGIGHGTEAAEAAAIAAATLEQQVNESVTSMLEACHGRLKDTRGAVITVAAFDGKRSTMAWVGVGNVEGRLLRADRLRPSEQLVLGAGIVGYRMPTLRPTTTRIVAGDILVLTTDGIDSDYNPSGYLNESPAYVADHILRHYRKGTDDALVVAARYTGS